MKPKFLCGLLFTLLAVLPTAVLASINFHSIPSNVQSNASYYVGANLYAPNGGELNIWKNNNWFASGYGWGNPQAGGWTSDAGPATIEYYAEGEDWNTGWTYFNWGYVNVAAGANTPPVPSVLVDGQSSGATVARPTGGSVNVTIRFKATDTDGNLSGIRPQVWDPAGNLNSNSGNFVAQSGATGEVVWTVSLNQNGNWHFWTDARDSVITPSFVSPPTWSNGFRLTVIETAPVPVVSSAASASGIVGNSFSYQIAATNSPTSYSASSLPAGLSLNSASGLISGSPIAGGTSIVTVSATNGHGTGTKQVTISVGSGWLSTVQSGYAYQWGQWQTAHFNAASNAINSSGAPQIAKDAAIAVLNQIIADAGNIANYNAYVQKSYSSGIVTGSAEFSREPEMNWYFIELSIEFPGYLLPVAFAFGDLHHTYNGLTRSASATILPTGATFTLDATRGPNVGAYTVFATANGFYGGTGSATLTIGQATQQIAFANPGIQAIGTSLTLTATASSGLNVSYSVVSGPATLSGNTLTFTALGFVTVIAAQGGSENYLPAANVQHKFLVGTGNPTLDSDDDGVPDDVELEIGLDRFNPNDARVFFYLYDKANQLKRGPGGEYVKDAEGNIKKVQP